MDGDDAWKSFVNWSKIDEWNSTDLTPSLEVYNELCGVWGLFKIGFIDWYDAFPQDTDSYMVELVLDSRITGTRREFPFKDATKHCPCDSSTGQESAARFGQHVVHCVEQSDACTANNQEDDDEEATDLRDVLTPILDLHHTAPRFFHLSGALCRYLVHVLARLWGTEWATLLDLGVDPVPVQSSGLFGEMAYIGEVLDRVTVDDVGEFCWMYMRGPAYGGGALECSRPRFVCQYEDVDDFLAGVCVWISSVSESTTPMGMNDFNDEVGVFESIRFLFLVDDMRTNCPTAIRVGRELGALIDTVLSLTKGVHAARGWKHEVPPL